MAGFNMVLKVRRLEQAANNLGFMFAASKYDNYNEYGERVSLKPINAKLPVYARDAEVFTGTLEELEVWLRGVEWARGYDMLLRLSDEKKRITAEDKYSKRLEAERLKAEQKAMWGVLKHPKGKMVEDSLTPS